MKTMSTILAFILGFFTYPISFLPFLTATDFSIECNNPTADSICVEGEYIEISAETDKNNNIILNDTVTIDISNAYFMWFNYYGIAYTSDAYIRGELSYNAGVKTVTEEFFLEPGDEVTYFHSFINNSLKGTKANKINSISFTPLDKDNAVISIYGFNAFNRTIPSEQIFIQNDYLKIGVDLLWGGALSYLEDLDSDVQVVNADGKIRVDSNAAERYNTKSLNNNVNLINRNDTGRLVQQSYYSIVGGDYEPGYYNDTMWRYNPVQGGNQYNDNSKIIDVKVEDNLIYIKCQPLDWAKTKDCITPSYMEAYYSLNGKMLDTKCRFVDFSGYEDSYTTQELPAFYCVAPLENYVYVNGNGELEYQNDLIFWPDAGYPNFSSKENWAAFMGEFDNSFGIGLYVPDDGETSFLAGIYERGQSKTSDPSTETPTSYMAVVKDMTFSSFSPYEYEFSITTGDVNEIRNTFGTK